MNVLCKKISPVGVFFFIMASAAQAPGYEDANIWRYAESSADMYTVPAGQYFWLYGIFFRVRGDYSATLRIDGNIFWKTGYGIDSWSHRFYPPVKFASGTVFTTDVGNSSQIMMYGYEGIFNGAEERNTGNFGSELNSRVEVHPVPFSNYTSVSYQVPKKNKVSIRIYDEAGRLVRTLVDYTMPQGSYTARWDGQDTEGRQVNGWFLFLRCKNGW